jgi:protoheme IX farnesyltransferase
MNRAIGHDTMLTAVQWRRRLLDLIVLTKPGVTALLVFTAVTTAWAASGPWVSPLRLLLLALAGGLTAGGSAALNQDLERELDAQMPRTARRPLPSGRLATPEIALGWGMFLCTTGLGLSMLTLPPESTLFILLGMLIYVPLYTWLLKRRTVWAVVIGGAAGSCPVLAGWAAARADWPVAPLALAALVFFWTPAHFWAYAMVHKEGYRRAGLPMLPSLIGLEATPPYILAHALPTVLAAALALSGAAAVVAGVAGIALLALGVALWLRPTPRWAWRFYKASNYYLVLVFLGLMIGG